MLYEEMEKKEIEGFTRRLPTTSGKAPIWNGSGLTSWAICC